MTRPKRPLSIRWFEALALVSIAASLAYSWLIWDEAAALVEGDGFGPGLMLAVVGLSLGLYLLLLWLIARRRSNVAKWIWILLTLFGLLFVLFDYRTVLAEDRIRIALTVLQSGLPVLALLLLFRREARQWFAGRDPVDPEVFS